MNYFVTGIGTNVGKTIVASILTEALCANYWKPIQSGVLEGKDSDTIKSLVSNSKSIFYPESYLLKEPLSPHFAAKIDSVSIELDKIQSDFLRFQNNEINHLIIEGAGGLLVPINTTQYVIDIAKMINCEIVLVISSYLGCINHSLLSIDYLMKNNFKIKALIFNGDFEKEVQDAIQNYISNTLIINVNNISLTKESVSALAKKIGEQWR